MEIGVKNWKEEESETGRKEENLKKLKGETSPNITRGEKENNKCG